MGFYGRHLFPRLMDWSLRGAQHGEHRRTALLESSGHVLEIGFGTWLNLPHYPEDVDAVTGVDRERMLQKTVSRRMAAAPVPVRQLQLDVASGLPFSDGEFDTVVSTWTLCSIADVDRALREIGRVLKPDGQFLFMEHGLSSRGMVARLQDLLNPLQNRIGQGCNLNRKIDVLLQQAGYEILRLERFCLPNLPRVVGEVYRGAARVALDTA
jgi:ubiquinone/menaquinone biosynthesis C-methylase UbiE